MRRLWVIGKGGRDGRKQCMNYGDRKWNGCQLIKWKQEPGDHVLGCRVTKGGFNEEQGRDLIKNMYWNNGDQEEEGAGKRKFNKWQLMVRELWIRDGWLLVYSWGASTQKSDKVSFLFKILIYPKILSNVLDLHLQLNRWFVCGNFFINDPP